MYVYVYIYIHIFSPRQEFCTLPPSFIHPPPLEGCSQGWGGVYKIWPPKLVLGTTYLNVFWRVQGYPRCRSLDSQNYRPDFDCAAVRQVMHSGSSSNYFRLLLASRIFAVYEIASFLPSSCVPARGGSGNCLGNCSHNVARKRNGCGNSAGADCSCIHFLWFSFISSYHALQKPDLPKKLCPNAVWLPL